MPMLNLNLSKLKLLPALLGWVCLFVALLFIAAMCIPSARANEPAPAITGTGLTCTPHKNFLGAQDGWDCVSTSTESTPLTIATPKGESFKFWCGDLGTDSAQCKGEAPQVVQSSAFGLVEQPEDLDLAMKCHITPPSLQAVCQVAWKAKVEK